MGAGRSFLEQVAQTHSPETYRHEHWQGSFAEYLDIVAENPKVTRTAYQRLYDAYQPGPVMDFKHYPKNFEYFHPGSHAADNRAALDYAGSGWRSEFSSAGMYRSDGWEGHRVNHPLIERGATFANT